MKSPIQFILTILFTANFFIANSQSPDPVPVVLEFDEIREITEINEETVADNYPWISEDGLRIYFNKTIVGEPYSHIFYAERPTIQDQFSTPQRSYLGLDEYDKLSPLLSDDELEIFFVLRDPYEIGVWLYTASRNSTDETFNSINLIELSGIDDISGEIYFMASPSFTPNMEQLYIYHNYQSNPETLILDKVSDNQYELSDTLEIPSGYTCSPGNLSDDGLKYYLSLFDTQTEEKHLYYFERNSTDEDFSDLFYISDSELCPDDQELYHPYFSDTEQFLVFAKSSASWTATDLFIAQMNDPSYISRQDALDFSISPNPANHFFMLQSHQHTAEDSFFLLYSSSGILMQKIKLSAGQQSLEISTQNLSSGTYMYQIITESATESGKILIRK